MRNSNSIIRPEMNRIADKKAPVASEAWLFGAGNETRTRDPNLGKVVLYQLSYSRTAIGGRIVATHLPLSTKNLPQM